MMSSSGYNSWLTFSELFWSMFLYGYMHVAVDAVKVVKITAYLHSIDQSRFSGYVYLPALKS